MQRIRLENREVSKDEGREIRGKYRTARQHSNSAWVRTAGTRPSAAASVPHRSSRVVDRIYAGPGPHTARGSHN